MTSYGAIAFFCGNTMTLRRSILLAVAALGMFMTALPGVTLGKTIVALGDSCTAKRGKVAVYANALAEDLRFEDAAVNVINAGAPGNTTKDARARFEQDVLAHEPDLVVIQFGINDAAVDVWRDPPATQPRVPLPDYRANLIAMARALQERGARAVLMTPNPIYWTPKLREMYGRDPYHPDDANGFNVMLRDYAQAVREVAQQERVGLIDVFAAFQEHDRQPGRQPGALCLDGMHPNDAGHRLIADLLIEQLTQMDKRFTKLSRQEPVKIIFDTDMDSDCDDVGALATLHALADRGEAEILATVASSRNEWSPACIDALNTFYGRPHLPIGRPVAGPSKTSKYARGIAERFPHDLPPADEVPDVLDVYRDALMNQPDQSVVVVTVGYLTNLATLLRQPGTDDQLSGAELARRKVKLWVCMGGNFVGQPAIDDLKLGNHNFTVDPESALYAVHHWPGPVMFVGREIGSVPSGLQVGAKLKELPESHPVRAGYALWFRGEPKDRHVADQTTVLFAVRGERDYWDLGPAGAMDLQRDMTFRWQANADGRQRYLLKRQRNGQPNDREIERAIEALMLQSPRAARR